MISNCDLLKELKKWVVEERKATLAVLERLREIQKRLLHLEMGYSSLHEFCVVELGYSDGAAYRRIHAMELCEELPNAREAIAEGKLSITNAALLQTYDGTIEAKEALLSHIQGKSRRECERILYPEVRGQKIEFVADDELQSDLKKLSELLGISQSDPAALVRKLAKMALRKVDPIGKKTRLSTSPEKLRAPKSPRYVSAALKKAVWVRDGGRCAFVNAATGKRCSSHFGLQIDHIVPVALGGKSTLENLRLLCFAHNHFEAQRILGRETMARFNPSIAFSA